MEPNIRRRQLIRRRSPRHIASSLAEHNASHQDVIDIIIHVL
jgi:hypothetical protein